MRRVKHISVRVIAAVVVLVAITLIAAVLALRSGWFREYVRARVIEELERSTGGHAEIGQFAFNWRTLTARVSGIVLHGTESADQAPFVQIDSAMVGLRV